MLSLGENVSEKVIEKLLEERLLPQREEGFEKKHLSVNQQPICKKISSRTAPQLQRHGATQQGCDFPVSTDDRILMLFEKFLYVQEKKNDIQRIVNPLIIHYLT